MVQLHNIKITANTLSYAPFTLSTQWVAVAEYTLLGSTFRTEKDVWTWHLLFTVLSAVLICFPFLSGPCLCASSLCLVEHVTLHSVHCWIFYLCVFPLSDSFDFQFGAVILRLKEGLDVSHIQGQGIKHTHTHAIVWEKRSVRCLKSIWFFQYSYVAQYWEMCAW